ncbi:hypothetical protein CERSUDRAFT_94730 [Gelatoporia subvermispora B]|uniref:Polyketide synthase phosphopantetheine-binding domain-containing protein n=1 Tax=Ceriporiopsis subvermispora (strain B) TaxID=914234 RepID=M2QZR0_CERS8|nr:hypothetical protein CERSUDRAFT_94730 [Gelatoporia subvermispora B]
MLDLKLLSAPQGINSRTWTRPPLDGSLKFPEMFELHAQHSPGHPLWVLQMRRRIFVQSTIPRRFALYDELLNWLSDIMNIGQDSPTLGILAATDTITCATLMIGIMYCGYAPFPISTRNSVTAVAHLVRSTDMRQIFVSPDPAMQHLAGQVRDTLRAEGHELGLVPMPQFTDLYSESTEHEDVEKGSMDNEKTIVILHTSGSTALPKPIRVKTFNMLRLCALPVYHGELDICGTVFGGQALPMFHAMGVLSTVWPPSTGAVVSYLRPSFPPIFPTPDVVLESLAVTGSEVVVCVPTFVEAWAKDATTLPVLLKQKAIIAGGAPLDRATADLMVNHGVKLTVLYGSTEAGVMSMFAPDLSKTYDWEYFRFSGHLDVEMIPQEGLENVYEAVILETSSYCPNVMNANVRGRRGYATNDLVQRHPTKLDCWRVYGRADDQLMLSTGEKTNPAPLEAILQKDPHIAAALMFGRGRFQNGVLIHPREPFDHTDTEKLAEFRNRIWSSVEKMNDYAPQHSRIFKEMIVVTRPSKPLEFTMKGNPRRQVCIDAYSEEIDAAYIAMEDSSQLDVSAPAEWTQDATANFVRAIVDRTLAKSLRDEDDLFQNGCDSLQATWIRNAILQALRSSTQLSLHQIPSNFVYTNPNIRALSVFVGELVSNNRPLDADTQTAAKIQAMQTMLDKYGSGFEYRAKGGTKADASDVRKEEVVLVTGTTGRLGCHLLAQLLRNPDVVKIYALNRSSPGSDSESATRQREAFKLWGLDPQLLTSVTSDKLQMLVCDYADPLLGLSNKEYHEIQQSVTTIIHNAWRVDFNLALPSFEPLIAGVRHIINLASGSPRTYSPSITFTSSISSLRSYQTPEPAAEKHFDDPRVCIGSGYGESKWIAEQLLHRAARYAGLKTTVVRVGQLSGDSAVGAWNYKEWVPAIVGLSQTFGRVPSRNQDITWVPVDSAASILLEMVHSDEKVLYLVHPRPVPWNAIFSPIAKRLGLPLVPYHEWVECLRESTDGTHVNGGPLPQSAALHLKEFFENDVGAAEIHLSTEKSASASEVLRHLKPLEQSHVLKWLDFWAKIGHIKL